MMQGDILFCRCLYKDVVPADARRRVNAALSRVGGRVTFFDDLCGAAAVRDPRLTALARRPPAAIVACRPRAVRWLLKWAGIEWDWAGVECLDLRTLSSDAVLGCCGVPGEPGEPPALPDAPGGWVPWFPVLDYDRCVNCKQCMTFCPFGVYGLADDRSVRVERPQACKDNCPACARMCPALAIVFPKVRETPIDGAEVQPAHEAARRAAGVDEQLKHSGDIHALLAQRRKASPGRRFQGPGRAASAPEPGGTA
jgi:NAD-dependent dihydropyrimidine dehydrogenase PreA subunit